MTTGTPRTRRTRFPLPPGSVAAARHDALLRPQAPLQQAHRDARRHSTPAGLGLDSAAVCARMVERLRAGGQCDERVLAAFAVVPRHRFVDSALANQAYEDTSLPIGHGQTISKPSVVARMLALLQQGEAARSRGHLGTVLEIGTGCGYQAALLATLARRVVSIERIAALAERARANLAAVGIAQVSVLHADGRAGYAPHAPYASIVAAAGGDDLPAAWLEQLAPGGRLVAPVRAASGGAQALVVVDRTATGLVRQRLEDVHFVPLKSGSE